MYYNYLKKYSILINKTILKEDTNDELEKIEEAFYKMNKIQVYGGKDGLLMRISKDYETNCILLQQHGIQNPKKISLLEFYQAIELIKQQTPKKHGKHRHKGRK